MEYKYYIADNQKFETINNMEYKIMSEHTISFGCVPLDGRYINFYTIRNYGISKFLDGLRTRRFIYLGDEASRILCQIRTLGHIYDPYELRYRFRDYPHIAHLCFNCFEDDHNGIWREFMKKNKGYFECLNLIYNIIGDDKSRFFIFAPNVDNQSSWYRSERQMVKYADNIIHELKNLSINLSGLKHTNSYLEYKNSILPPGLKRAIIMGGLFIVKAAVKSIGANIDSALNINISDTDSDFDGVDIDSEFETEGLPDGNCLDVNYEIEYGGYDNISFQGSSKGKRTSEEVKIISEYQNDKGSFDVYLKDGKKCIYFEGNRICIQENNSFTLRGVRYRVQK